MALRLSLTIPTYNEKGNIAALVAEVGKQFAAQGIPGEIIIVDDHSPDGTGQVAEDLAKRYGNVRVVHRSGKLGLSSAVLEAWKVASGDVLMVMDADLSHPVEKIPVLYDLIARGEADFAVGSRYVPGGKILGWGLKRKILSWGATRLARFFTKVQDPMSGFFAIKREVVQGVELNPQGFKILLELLVKARYHRVTEVPIVFTNRVKGASKAGAGEILYYLGNLWGYLFYKNDKIIKLRQP